MKSSIFDFIIYKIIMSVPVSIIANIIFVYMFFIAILTWFPFERLPIDNGRHMIYIIFSYMMAIVPFYLFNIVRFKAMNREKLSYGIFWFILSFTPIYLFILILLSSIWNTLKI